MYRWVFQVPQYIVLPYLNLIVTKNQMYLIIEIVIRKIPNRPRNHSYSEIFISKIWSAISDSSVIDLHTKLNVILNF